MIALAMLLAVLAVPAPDVLPPGSRSISHQLVLETAPQFEQFDLYAFPVRGFGGITALTPGVPFDFSSKYGTRIYALPRGSAIPDDREPPLAAARAVGNIPVQETASVPMMSPTEHVLTRLRIVELVDGVLRMEVAGEQTVRDWSVIAWTCCAIGLGVGALFVLRRSRARRTAGGAGA